MNKEQDQQLIDAVNLLGEYTSQHLAQGWQIRLDLASDECSCDLIDPQGEVVHVDTEWQLSAIRLMCDQSWEEIREIDTEGSRE